MAVRFCGYVPPPLRANAVQSAPFPLSLSKGCLARMMQAVKDMSDGSRKAIRLIHL